MKKFLVLLLSDCCFYPFASPEPSGLEFRWCRTAVQTALDCREALVNPVVAFFIGVELQVGEAQFVQNTTNIGYIIRSAQHSAAAMLEIGCAREVLYQPFAKLGILSREHLGLHATEPAGASNRIRRTIVLARFAGRGALGIDDADAFLGVWQCSPRQMA